MNKNPVNGRLLASALLAILLGASAQTRALTITPTYINAAGETWGSDRITMFDAAIDLWEAKVTSLGDVAVDVTFDDLGAGATLAVWGGSIFSPFGADLAPDSPYVSHEIVFNTDNLGSLFFDSTPNSDSDLPFAKYDAFSVALHEIGHMLGFTNDFYLRDFGGLSEYDPWGGMITGNTFDLGGLNVAMNADHAHITSSGGLGGYLMEPAIFNGERRLISDLELQMLATAYGYSVVPVPAALPLLLSGLGVLGLLRRRVRNR